MNDVTPDQAGASPRTDVFFSTGTSLVLLTLAAIIVLATQLRIAVMEKSLLETQLNFAAQRLTTVKATRTQTEEAIEKQEQQIKRSSALETQYAALLTELIELAKVDPDARAITQKWKIQQQGQAQEQAAKPPAEVQTVPPAKVKGMPSGNSK